MKPTKGPEDDEAEENGQSIPSTTVKTADGPPATDNANANSSDPKSDPANKFLMASEDSSSQKENTSAEAAKTSAKESAGVNVDFAIQHESETRGQMLQRHKKVKL